MSGEGSSAVATFRPFRPEDEEFLAAVYGSTRESELAQVPWSEEQRRIFIRFQSSAQLRHYQSEYPQAVHTIIELDEIPVGRVYVDRREDEIRILDITLLPERRGRGIGSPIIKNLMLEAAQTGKAVSVHIESFGAGSRSQGLFERLGFKPAESNGFHTLYVWREDAS